VKEKHEGRRGQQTTTRVAVTAAAAKREWQGRYSSIVKHYF
jgi:hypothetical protein